MIWILNQVNVPILYFQNFQELPKKPTAIGEIAVYNSQACFQIGFKRFPQFPHFPCTSSYTIQMRGLWIFWTTGFAASGNQGWVHGHGCIVVKGLAPYNWYTRSIYICRVGTVLRTYVQEMSHVQVAHENLNTGTVCLRSGNDNSHMFVGYPSHAYVLYNKFMLYIHMASSRLSLEGCRSPCFNPWSCQCRVRGGQGSNILRCPSHVPMCIVSNHVIFVPQDPAKELHEEACPCDAAVSEEGM